MRLTLAFMFLLLAAYASAQTAARSSLRELFEAANVSASRGDYETAISNYHRLVESGVRDPDVYFNLATAFAQAGDYPRAILNYERALERRPGDDQTEENLRTAEKTLEERRAESEGEATIQRSISMSDAIYSPFTEDALAVVLVASNFVFFGCLAWIWAMRRRRGRLLGLAIGAGFVLGFCALGLGVKAGMFRDGVRAVAIGDRVILREGPDEDARIRGEARGGDRAEVLAFDRDFVKLRVVSGAEGWANAGSVGLVDPDARLH
jgi:tetratricopeptide (TPR) repeat protein